MKKLFVVIAILVSLGTTSAQADTVGAIVGGVVGGVVGSRFGQGNGNTIATAVGATAGAIIGDRMSSQPSSNYGYRPAVYRPQSQPVYRTDTTTSGNCASRYSNDEELYRECQIGAAKKAAANRSEELRAARDYGGGSVSEW